MNPLTVSLRKKCIFFLFLIEKELLDISKDPPTLPLPHKSRFIFQKQLPITKFLENKLKKY